MGNMNVKIYPKVFETGKTHTIFISAKLNKNQETQGIFVKIQPMEAYGVPHSKIYRIDEEERYDYIPAKQVKNGLYQVGYAFFDEQKYDVKVKCGEEVILNTRVYSIFEDLVGLIAYKGDTHLHSNRSDGEGTPFEVGCAYRAAGYDFIAITDHHRYFPSLEGKAAFDELTNEFTVFKGEEIHNRDMGYTHIINFDGNFSVNDIVEKQWDFVENEVEKILKDIEINDTVADKKDCAYRIFISNQIRKGAGVSIMAHPFWDCFGEYNMPTKTVEYLLKNNCYDALELLAGNDLSCQNGNNLQIALWGELQTKGVQVAVLGASDAHSTKSKDTLFNKQFSFVFAKNRGEIKNAIRERKTVAILVIDKVNYMVFGDYRLVKYARFLFDEYFPTYQKLTRKHARALAERKKDKISKIEKAILAFKKDFFAW